MRRHSFPGLALVCLLSAACSSGEDVGVAPAENDSTASPRDDRRDEGAGAESSRPTGEQGADAGTCASGQKRCDGRCVSLEDATFGCGATSCEPCSASPNATAVCSPTGACELQCKSGYSKQGAECVEDFVERVSSGFQFACGLRADRSIACGRYFSSGIDYGQANPPAGTFSHVSVGWFHACAVRTDGSVACWGRNLYGETSPPPGTFRQVASGVFHTCGVRTDGSVTCWGSNYKGRSAAPTGKFRQIAADGFSCGVREDGSLACWGPVSGTTPAGKFVQVSVGSAHACAVRMDGTVACWGANEHGANAAPAGRFRQVDAHYYHSCGVRDDGSIACWGSNADAGFSPTPAGPFRQVSIGYTHSCGLTASASIKCWGKGNAAQAAPTGTF